MVRHIVLLSYKDGFSPEQNRHHAEQIKRQLEGLKSIISGIIEFDVIIDALPTSNRDVVLNTLFESTEALDAYQVHPEHVKVASFVGSVMTNRACIDYDE